ncbi:MAG: gliding motility-associated C-terminal domain-containing protein [Ferruginibacter sp.]|nr:gliding motility-associated C-terminal domain-containing protein [Ferruginibacter sp.]
MSISIKKSIILSFLCAYSCFAYSQVCTGSLGDAVVNINFGNGSSTIGTALLPAVTTYNFVSSDCPIDGSYTIISQTNNCFGGSWHNITQDHTPNDVNGYMMLINASITPGDFYVDTVKGLCANSTYEFSAWVTNVLKTTSCQPNPTRPRLTFTIETPTGTVLSTFTTADITEDASPTWKQYGLFFTTPSSVGDVVVRLRNNGPGGCGNDLALDDIAFRPCGPQVTTSVLNTSQTNVSMCVNNTSPITLSGVVGTGYLNPSLQWQVSTNNGVTWANIAGATTATFNFTNTTVDIYQYRLLVAEAGNINNTNCRVASNTTTITISDLPIITAGSNSPVCEGANITLTANGGNRYSWVGPNGYTSNLQNPVLVAGTNTSGTYTVTGFNTFNCSSTDNTTIVVLPKPIVAIAPTAASICIADSVLLTASGGNSYVWLPTTALTAPTAASTFAKPITSTTYTVVATGANTCIDSAKINVQMLQKPIANAGEDITLIKGQTAVLQGSIDAIGTTYFWTPIDFLNNPNSLNPITTATRNIEYVLHANSILGCGTATDTVLVKVYNDLYIPNTFTPNGDGKNDTWKIDALAAYPTAKTIIYNRYGQIVFEANSAYQYWDGKFKGAAVPNGGYTYVIDLRNNGAVIKGVLLVVR